MKELFGFTLEELDTRSLESLIEEQLIARILATPEFRREELRFLYGTRAIKQPLSRHKETRRKKRRKR